VDYVVIGIIVVVGGAIALGARHVRHENSPGARPSLVAARRVMRQSRMAASDLCVCGGTLQATGDGGLLGCTGCRRSWTEDGRHVVRRRQIRRPRSSAARRAVPPS
jgi:hypothetical protein